MRENGSDSCVAKVSKAKVNVWLVVLLATLTGTLLVFSNRTQTLFMEVDSNVTATQPLLDGTGLCATHCAKTPDGRVAEFSKFANIGEFPVPQCARTGAQYTTTTPTEKVVYNAESQKWPRWENLADRCNDIHGLDRNLYHNYDSKTLHIVYFTWMAADRNVRKIIPPQMADVIASGIFDRPNTKIYIVVSTQLDEEYDWFAGQPWVSKYKPQLIRSRSNQYEFAGVRFLWELACKHTDDLFLYFHSKGARYGVGRIGMEVILTKEIIVEWKLLLNLLAAHPSSQSVGLGGPGFHWMNFFFAHGSLFLTVPKPPPVNDRYWYENWIGVDLRGGQHHIAETSVSQCAQATGMEAALLEPIVPEPAGARGSRAPQYSLLRCSQARVSSPQLDTWSVPAAKRMDEWMATQKTLTPYKQ